MTSSDPALPPDSTTDSAAAPFSPRGRRCPEGADEGALGQGSFSSEKALVPCGPSSDRPSAGHPSGQARGQALLPRGEKGLAADERLRAGRIAQARMLRREMTEPERALWYVLRARRFSGFKFRRQVPVGPYIADFICFDRRLVVECDGGQHAESARDARRDAWFAAQGYRTLRFWNHEVMRERQVVADTVWAALAGKTSGEPATSVENQFFPGAPSSDRPAAGHLLPRGEKGRARHSEDATAEAEPYRAGALPRGSDHV